MFYHLKATHRVIKKVIQSNRNYNRKMDQIFETTDWAPSYIDKTIHPNTK